MATIGKIEEFNQDTEVWTQYVERLEHFFVANDIEVEKKKKSTLLAVCEARTYELIRSLCLPDKPAVKSYCELKTLLENHMCPKPSVIMKRFKFNSRFKLQSESVSTFIADLRKLAEHCEYGDQLADMLRDRLVCGIDDRKIQARLLADGNLDFKKVEATALAMEAAARDTQDLQQAGEQRGNHVNRITERRGEEGSEDTQRRRFASLRQCFRCGGQHMTPDCRFSRSTCYVCKKVGHLARMCRNKSDKNSKMYKIENGASDDSEECGVEEYAMYTVSKSREPPVVVHPRLNKVMVPMEIDTGAAVSVLSKKTYEKSWKEKSKPVLKVSEVVLRTYSGDVLKVLGEVEVEVEYGNQLETLPLVVVDGDGPNLLGRTWLRKIKLDWGAVYSCSTDCDSVIRKFDKVFKDELGLIKSTNAVLYVDKEASPRFFKARPLPYALKEKVELELEQLVKDGVIEPVQFSEWAAPIVPIVKVDNSIRICGDYKLTVNRVCKVDSYPIPKIEDLLANLAGGKTFSKLDLSHAYSQLPLDEESKKFVTINTHKGLFQYNRLPYGVSSAPGIFQRVMENLLQGIPHVVVYLDDILVTGKTDKEHLSKLTEILKRMDEAGVRLKLKKCVFQAPEVTYLGHKINAEGLHPTDEKVKAIVSAPTPSNTTEVKSYLGLVNYYGRYISNLCTVFAPLYRLLQKEVKWQWGRNEQRALSLSKQLLASSRVLMHYDSSKPLLLTCDASSHGLGAVLSHRLESGEERPNAFASRTLGSAERKYAQIEKEGLAVIFGVKKFHNYLYGRHFEIISDHHPLKSLFSESPRSCDGVKSYSTLGLDFICI